MVANHDLQPFIKVQEVPDALLLNTFQVEYVPLILQRQNTSEWHEHIAVRNRISVLDRCKSHD